MENEMKTYLHELYKRQVEELKKLIEFRNKLFEQEKYKFLDELKSIERELSEVTVAIISCFQRI